MTHRSDKVPAVLAPLAGRLHVRLPWQPHGRNYELLRDVCGERTRAVYDRERRVFLVARPHLGRLINALVTEFGACDLTRHGSTATTCCTACLKAAGDDCTCACAGEHHGDNAPPNRARTVVADSPVGDVYVIPGGRVTRTVRLTPASYTEESR